jgi:hypothetical protein
MSLFYGRPLIHQKPLINQASARNSPQLVTSALSGVSARTTSEISNANSPLVASRKGVFTFSGQECPIPDGAKNRPKGNGQHQAHDRLGDIVGEIS